MADMNEMEYEDMNSEGKGEGEKDDAAMGGKETDAKAAVAKALDMIPPEYIVDYMKEKQYLPPDFELPTNPGEAAAASESPAPETGGMGDISYEETATAPTT